MRNIYIVEALRTAIGNFNGSLSSLKAHELGSIIIKEIIERNKLEPHNINEVILGQVLMSIQGQNPARQASINAKIPHTVPAWNISQVCGSGLRAIALAAQTIKSGDNSVVIAGGQESMSQAPHAMLLRPGTKMGDAKMIDTMISDGLWDAFNNYHMGVTAENISKEFNISREEQDSFAVASQSKAAMAQQNGLFTNEIVPVKIVSKKEEIIFQHDEFVRANTSLDSLAKLKPAFDKDGTVTAGNASGINDGAAAMLLVSEDVVEKFNLRPLARLVSYAQSGVDPRIMGTGPIDAVKFALEKANWSIKDLDLIESNEAFAAQAIAVNKALNWDLDIVNVNGGAIALGHPIGASGARIAVTLLHAMQARKAHKGLATLCVGGGMGVAVCFERV